MVCGKENAGHSAQPAMVLYVRMGRRFLRKSFLPIISIGLVVAGTLTLWAATLPLPDWGSFDTRKVTQSTKIYDRTGTILLFDLNENIKRTVIPYDEMSRHIKNATVAIEDAEFYEHRGVKPRAILRAVLVNLGSFGFTQGGSTITQQVVKNSLLTTEKSIARKLKEWVLAVKLEEVVPKERILETYLNETPYGGSLYGVEEASQAFFSKNAAGVTLAEAAYLAAIIKAPTYYSPYGNHKAELDRRKDLVLSRMLENGFITTEEYEVAKGSEVVFSPQRGDGIRAPHFVFYIREYLEEKYGERALDEKGLRVITTLDYSLQEKAEEIVLRYATENETRFNAKNAALVAVDPKTGQILTMVGSRDYFDEEVEGAYNIALAERQPGSAFKPFVYAEALRKGYTPETVVFDVPTQFSTLCPKEDLTSEDGCYAPKNYDNVFRGPVTFRNALAQSINIPAVKVLYLAGLTDALRLAKDMGVRTLTNIDRYGLTLVLGGGEVSLLDMTSAYGVFANEGSRLEPTGILRIENHEGEVLEEYTARTSNVLERTVALTISDMLSDNVARAPAFGENSYLHFPGRSVAAKTGTTNDYRDAWVLGYTPSIAVGAWAGNNDNSSMEKKVAGFIVAPLWSEFMRVVLAKSEEVPFGEPQFEDTTTLKAPLRGIWQGGDTVVVDRLTGTPANDTTPPNRREERVFQNIHSILYWVARDDPRGGRPEHPENDSQFERWEYGVSRWLTERGMPQSLPVPVPVVAS